MPEMVMLRRFGGINKFNTDFDNLQKIIPIFFKIKIENYVCYFNLRWNRACW